MDFVFYLCLIYQLSSSFLLCYALGPLPEKIMYQVSRPNEKPKVCRGNWTLRKERKKITAPWDDSVNFRSQEKENMRKARVHFNRKKRAWWKVDSDCSTDGKNVEWKNSHIPGGEMGAIKHMPLLFLREFGLAYRSSGGVDSWSCVMFMLYRNIAVGVWWRSQNVIDGVSVGYHVTVPY